MGNSGVKRRTVSENGTVRDEFSDGKLILLMRRTESSGDCWNGIDRRDWKRGD